MKATRLPWALVLSLAAAGAASGAAVAPCPSKPVRLVVPFAAGGLNDTLARVLGLALSDHLGVTTAYIESEIARWGKVVQALGLKPE